MILNGKENATPNLTCRMSLLVTPETAKALNYCARNLEFENKSMVVRRAIATYIKQNLTGEELEQLSE